MDCTEFEELSGAYVLDAVTPEERRAAEEHLAQCDRCTHLYRELRAGVDALPLSVPQVDPPLYLKERVLAAIQAEERSAASPSSVPRIAPAPRPDRRARRRRAPIPAWAGQLIAAAAVVLLVLSSGLTAWNVSLQQQNAALRQQNHALRQQVVVLTNQIRGQAAAPEVTGQLIYIPQQNVTILKVQGLPETSGNQVYQGWLLKGSQPISIGLLTIRHGVATIGFSDTPSGFDTVAVSQEKGPGPSPKPSTVVAAGPIAPSPHTA